MMKISTISLILSVILVSAKMQEDSSIRSPHLSPVNTYDLQTEFESKLSISKNGEISMISLKTNRSINVQSFITLPAVNTISSKGFITKTVQQTIPTFSTDRDDVSPPCVGSSCFSKVFSTISSETATQKSNIAFLTVEASKHIGSGIVFKTKNSSEFHITSSQVQVVVPSFSSMLTKYSSLTPKLETVAKIHSKSDYRSISLLQHETITDSKSLSVTPVYSGKENPSVMVNKNESSLLTKVNGSFVNISKAKGKGTMYSKSSTGSSHAMQMSDTVGVSKYFSSKHEDITPSTTRIPFLEQTVQRSVFSTITDVTSLTRSYKLVTQSLILPDSLSASTRTTIKPSLSNVLSLALSSYGSVEDNTIGDVRTKVLLTSVNLPKVKTNMKWLSPISVHMQTSFPAMLPNNSKLANNMTSRSFSKTTPYKSSSSYYDKSLIFHTSNLNVKPSYKFSTIPTKIYGSSERTNHLISSYFSKEIDQDRSIHHSFGFGTSTINKTQNTGFPAKSYHLMNSEIQNTHVPTSVSAFSKQLLSNASFRRIWQSTGVTSSLVISQKHSTMKTVNLLSTLSLTTIISIPTRSFLTSVHTPQNSLSRLDSNFSGHVSYTHHTILKNYSASSHNVNNTRVFDVTSAINSTYTHQFTTKPIYSSFSVVSHNSSISVVPALTATAHQPTKVTTSISSKRMFSQHINISATIKFINSTVSNLVKVASSVATTTASQPTKVTTPISSNRMFSQHINISATIKVINSTGSNFVKITSSATISTNKTSPSSSTIKASNIPLSGSVTSSFAFISSTTAINLPTSVTSTILPTSDNLPSLVESFSERTMSLTITIPTSLLEANKLILLVQEYHKDNSDANITTWYKANMFNHYRYYKYKALRLNVHNRRKRSLNNSKIVHIGYSKCTSRNTICNGPLIAGAGYRFQIEAHTGKDIIYTPFTVVHYTKKNHVYTNKSNSTILIILSVLLVCFIVLTLVILVVVCRRRRGRGVCGDSGEVRSTLMGPCNKTSSKSRKKFTGPDILMERKKSIKGMTRPVSVRDFQAWVHRSCSDSDFRFAEEFESMRDVGKLERHEVADMPENRGKNRYVNVLSYDYTRVKLSSVDDEPGSDYVNANYIHGYKQPRAYIATQGPLPSTTDDFWRMTWEQNSRIIVMVTQCMERAKVKCHQYWPTTEPTRYGDIVVTLISEKSYSEWIEREFHLEYEEETRKLRHFQYIGWPDHGVPKTVNEMLEFVQTVKYYQTTDDGPLICHCSAGVGRTGTYLCIDILMNKLQYESNVDVYGVVCIMRTQRCNMVQTEDQYIFIHRVILHYLKQRDEKQQIFSGYSTLTLERKERKTPKVEREETSLDIEEPNVCLLNKTDFLSELDNELYVSRVYDSST